MPIANSVPHVADRELRPSTRPIQWPLQESAAIQQWREITAGVSRRSGQSRVHHHESQPRDADTHHSNVESSTSEDSGKKPRDVTSHLKYLVRGFLKQFRATSPASDVRREDTPNKDSFVPSPKITFLIDSPNNLTCQICQHAPLKMAISAENPEPSMTAILPCGHIACHGCMNFWFSNHTTCPFCRTLMIHIDCRHPVRPRLIAQDTIHTLPETLANGGKIGGSCFKCTERRTRQSSVMRLAKLAERFKVARREAEDIGTREAMDAMQRAQDAFEKVPENDFWTLSRLKHHQCNFYFTGLAREKR